MRIHIVRPKETLVTIANKYQVTLDDLRQFNPDFIQPDCLVAGMKVYVPNLKKVSEALGEEDPETVVTTAEKENKKNSHTVHHEMNVTGEPSSNVAKATILPKEHHHSFETVKQLNKEEKVIKQPKKSLQKKQKNYEPWPPIARSSITHSSSFHGYYRPYLHQLSQKSK